MKIGKKMEFLNPSQLWSKEGRTLAVARRSATFFRILFPVMPQNTLLIQIPWNGTGGAQKSYLSSCWSGSLEPGG
jgi:hypothetical protein